MRWLALAAGIFALGPVGEAVAAPRIDVEWTTTGAGPVDDNRVQADVGDFVTATITLENVGGSIGAYWVSFTYDTAELSLVSTTEFLPSGFDGNLSSGMDESSAGFVGGYEAYTLPLSGVSGSFAIGEAEFEVIAVIHDNEPDFETGLHTENDVIADEDGYGLEGQTLYGSGRVVAEGFAGLPGLGGIALALLGGSLGAAAVRLLRRRS